MNTKEAKYDEEKRMNMKETKKTRRNTSEYRRDKRKYDKIRMNMKELCIEAHEGLDR